MEIIIVAVYAVILALVAPYVFQANEFLGRLVPLGMALVSSSVLWAVFTWIGMSHSEPWIWFGVMLGSPVFVWFGVHWLQAKRLADENSQLAALEVSQ
jgi:hypothetical protein